MVACPGLLAWTERCGHSAAQCLLLLCVPPTAEDRIALAPPPAGLQTRRYDHPAPYSRAPSSPTARAGTALSKLGGIEDARQLHSTGLIVGLELRRVRAARVAIDTVDWASIDAPWHEQFSCFGQ